MSTMIVAAASAILLEWIFFLLNDSIQWLPMKQFIKYSLIDKLIFSVIVHKLYTLASIFVNNN